MSVCKFASSLAFFAFIGFSWNSAFAAIDTNTNLNDTCVCASPQGDSQSPPNSRSPSLCISSAKAQLDEANHLGDGEEGRKVVRDFARRVKALASCDIGLATDLAALAAEAPDWVQVAFGAELDGTGTGSVGPKKPPSGGTTGSSGSPS
jgi:hypothetical protein